VHGASSATANKLCAASGIHRYSHVLTCDSCTSICTFVPVNQVHSRLCVWCLKENLCFFLRSMHGHFESVRILNHGPGSDLSKLSDQIFASNSRVKSLYQSPSGNTKSTVFLHGDRVPSWRLVQLTGTVSPMTDVTVFNCGGRVPQES
jgi:hypothetical protein